MLRVVATYTLMFSKNDLIDDDLQNTFFQTIRDERVFQKILYVDKSGSYDTATNDLISRYPGGGYQHNYHGHIVELGNSIYNQRDQREIIMQSLGTIIMTLKLMSDDFDHWDPNSALSKAYQEAVDKNLFSYAPERPEFGKMSEEQTIYKFLARVILTEWGNRFIDNFSGEGVLKIEHKDDLINKLPLSHKLYVEYIEKILYPIDQNLLNKIY